jgi:integral membrane sensor domain MASE1
MALHNTAYISLFARQTGVALCYALLAKLVLAFYSANGMVSILWPASGLALAAILLGGTRFWIGIFAGALITELFIAAHTSIYSLLIATGATLEPLLGALLLKRLSRFDLDLTSPRDYFLLLLVSFASPSICAATGVTSLLLEGHINGSAYCSTLTQWWMGNTLGIALVTPLILVWRKPAAGWLKPRRMQEVVVILLLSFCAGQIVFLDWFHELFGAINRGYWMYLFVTLAAARLGRHGVLIVLWIITLQSLAGIATGAGYFSAFPANNKLIAFWSYIAILSVVGMSWATLLKAHLHSETKLRQSESTYRSLFDNMLNSVVHARVIFEQDKPIDMEYLTVNPAFASITGITEPVIGRRISEVIPGYCKNNPESLEIFGRVAVTGVATRWEHHLRELDRWFSFVIYSPAPGEVIIVTENITERKQAELALIQQTTELRNRNDELERFNRASVGRELDMIAMKQQINALSDKLGVANPYPLAFLNETKSDEKS